MAPRPEPSSLRWLIGVELAGYRKDSGKTLAEVSAEVGISKPKLGHMETGRYQQAPEDIAKLLAYYGAAQHEIDRLMSLTGRADEASWWAPWGHIVPDWLKTFVGLEALAEREFVFEPIVIPGLLQTEDYARAITAATPRVRPDHGERFVGFRMARARRLTDADGRLHLHAVLNEGALRLRVGTPELQRAQLEHLVAASELPNVTLQVVRPEDGVHAAATGHFVVLEFENARSIGYSELSDGAVYAQDPEQVRSYTMAAENLQGVALDPERSVALIKSMIGT
jgi:transcriptional regulator with XRE-family HTH domain